MPDTPDQPITPDWVGLPGESVQRDAATAPGGSPGHGRSPNERRQPREAKQPPPAPKDVPLTKRADDIVANEAVNVRRFAGLGNRILAVLAPILLIGVAALTFLVARAGLGGLLDSASGELTTLATVEPVVPSETTLAVWLDAFGDMASASLIGVTAQPLGSQDAVPKDRAVSSVLVLSPESRLGDGGERLTLRALFGLGHASMVADEISSVFNIAIDDVQVFDASMLAELVESVPGSVSVTVEEPLLRTESIPGRADDTGSAVPVFLAGNHVLRGADVGNYVALLNSSEDRSAHLSRQQVLWEALRAALRSGDDAVSEDSPLWLRGLAASKSTIATVESVPGRDRVLAADLGLTRTQLATIIPNPRPALGQTRPTVRLLNAGTDTSATDTAMRQIVALGGQVVSVGGYLNEPGANPDESAGAGANKARVVVHTAGGGAAQDGSDGDAAQELSALLASALDVEVEADFANDAVPDSVPFDFTVVVGLDPVQDGGE